MNNSVFILSGLMQTGFINSPGVPGNSEILTKALSFSLSDPGGICFLSHYFRSRTPGFLSVVIKLYKKEDDQKGGKILRDENDFKNNFMLYNKYDEI